MRVLVVNAGSATLKLSLLDGDDRVLESRLLETAAGEGTDGEVDAALRGLGARADAVGHRVVHGGGRTGAVRLDAGVEAELRALTVLAPLHQPPALRGIDAVSRLLPGLPAVACFDTAFHSTIPQAARTYAVPADWRERLGVRRYGFHGLSHAHVARRAAGLLGAGAAARLVSCHLGAGASLAAVRDGVCADTTMGFTPLEGLVMATRSGSVDPGAVLWLVTQAGMDAGEVGDALEHGSGLLGLCGSGDMREVRRRAEAGDAQARSALDVYVHRLVQSVAAMAASLGGLEALAFTGGVGEHDATLRAEVAERLAFLGVALDAGRNAAARGDAEVGAAGAAVRTLVVTAREDLEIARQARAVLA